MRSRILNQSSTCLPVSLFLVATGFAVTLGGLKMANAATVEISFEKVRQVRLGSTQREAEAVFGRPSKTYREKNEGYVTWVYTQGLDANQLQKLSLTFSSKDYKLAAVSYFPEAPDTVARFDGLIKEYPMAKFRTVAPASCGQHFALNEGFEYDLSSGIRIQKDTMGRVTDLHLSLPLSEESRKTASEPTGCPDRNKLRSEFVEITPALK